MTTKERIQAVIESVGDDNLEELYGLIREFVDSRKELQKTGIMGKLKTVKIEAPADFATNLDHYLTGEKRVEDNLH